MHIHIVPNRGAAPTVLLRESFREGSKLGKRTLVNLSSLSNEQIEATREPAAPAKRSKAALAKAARHTLDDSTPVHSFSTGRARHHRAQHLPHAACRARFAHLRGPHHAKPKAAARLRTAPEHPLVGSSHRSDLTPKCLSCNDKLLAACRNSR